MLDYLKMYRLQIREKNNGRESIRVQVRYPFCRWKYLSEDGFQSIEEAEAAVARSRQKPRYTYRKLKYKGKSL